MFLGHFALGLAAKRLAPRTSLGTLFAAAQLLDLVWPAFLLVGLERVRIHPGDTAFSPLEFTSYPWTHSLALVLGWGACFGLAARALGVARRDAWVLGALVASHWFLDLVVHRPDLPLAPGAVRVGLGLWRSVPATVGVEGTLFVAGFALYATGTRARDRAGRLGLAALVATLAAIYAASVGGPPPPGVTAVAVAGLLLWLFVPWAAWVDRHRQVTGAHAAPAAAEGR